MTNQNALVNDPRLRFKQTKHPHAWAVVSSTSTGAICADKLPTEGTDSNLAHHVCVVTVSDTRTIGGMNTTASARIALVSPLPNMPQIAIASRIEGNA